MYVIRFLENDMQHERIFLDSADDRVYIDTYVANNRTFLHSAMLIIPGGGYSQICTEREGEPVAFAYLEKGFNCFVLNYRVNKDPYPSQLIDASRAILHIRDNAEKYCIDPNRVFAVGFSAGGHLAGSLAILHNDPDVLSALGISEGDNCPDGVVLGYPVVSAMHPTHHGSFINLMGGKEFQDITEEEKKNLSLEVHVNEKSAPAYIFHTAEDAVVPAFGSLALAAEYVRAGVPVKFNLYPYGPHGIALANGVTACGNDKYLQPLAEEWVEDSVRFLNTLKK